MECAYKRVGDIQVSGEWREKCYLSVMANPKLRIKHFGF